jgi:hypothetical protein
MAGRSIFNPEVPAGAYDDFVVEAAPRSAAQRGWLADACLRVSACLRRSALLAVISRSGSIRRMVDR